MHVSYNILRGAAPALVQAFHGRRDVIVGRWMAQQWPHWVLGYCPADGVDVVTSTAGRETGAFRRRARLWHLYPPDTKTSFRFASAQPFQIGSWVIFDLDGSLLPRDTFTAFADPDERIADLVQCLHDAQQRGEAGHEVLVLGTLVTLIGELTMALRRGGRGDENEPCVVRVPGPEGLLAQVDAVVLADLQRPPPLSEIADRLHLSVSSLSHRFRNETGMTVIQRIRWLRIREARRLLAERDVGMKSIAVRLGFSSPAYFSQVFKDVVGMSPASFRRLLL